MPDELDRILRAYDLPREAATELRMAWPDRRAREDVTTQGFDDPPTLQLDDAVTPGPVGLLDANHPRLAGARVTEGLPDAPSSPTAVGSERYEVLGQLGIGGFAEVWRVRDRVLDRTVAMKVTHAKLLTKPESMRRFMAEAHATSRLQHPNIVPVYDVGRLDDGRAWFTMREVHGQTLRHWLVGKPSLVRRVTVFLAMCHGVAYAHGLGVVHRDLKPSNVMLGPSGEVYVLDWGIAKFLGDVLPDGPLVVDGPHTAQGWVGGTPGYMPPEQASGQVSEVDQRADVFALGAVLYELLEGRRAYSGDTYEALAATIDGVPQPLWEGHPQELREVVRGALARRREDRFPDAAAMVEPLQAWLDGAQRRSQALTLTERALVDQERAGLLRDEAESLRRDAQRELSEIPLWAPEARKVEAWALEDEAAAAELQAELADQDVELGLLAALQLAPDLHEAHAALVQRLRAAHAVSELARETVRAHKQLRALVRHARALPANHRVRQSAEAYVAGMGAVTLHTEPPGAAVGLHRVVPQGRRLGEVFERDLGSTPLEAEPVELGSWVLSVAAPGHATVRVPVLVPRLGHHDGVPPEGSATSAIVLPRVEELGDDEVYVPAGWYDAGSPDVGASPRRLWVDGFVIQRFPVTHRAFLVFLHDLVSTGRVEEALRHAPRERASVPDELGALLLDFDGTRFALRPDAQGDRWDLDWPVFQIDWHGAVAYGHWLADRTGLPWRLPSEFEWEKAARGVDGRRHPWGEHVDPSFARMAESRPGRSIPVPVDRYPTDVSVYGVRGLGGNVQDWCLERYDAPLPPSGTRLVPTMGDTSGDPVRMARGGGWDSLRRSTRSASRSRAAASYRSWMRGVRLVRPFPAS